MRTSAVGYRLLLGVILLLALGLRIWDFPAPMERRNSDEGPYCWGSLQLLEGMVPEYKYSPGGPQIWAGWAYAGGVTLRYCLLPTAEEANVDIRLRPFVATNHALFDLYRDITPIRNVWILIALPVVLFAVVMGFRVGFRWAGLPGGVLAGSVVAATPIFVGMSSEARPYAMGWTFAIIAIACSAMQKSARGRRLAAIWFGLAIATRVDVLMLLPLAWSDLFANRHGNDSPGDLAHSFSRFKDKEFWIAWLRFNLMAMLVALLVSPWLLTNVIGNLRIIATVRLETPAGGPIPITTPLWEWGHDQGMFLIVPLAAIGLFLKRPRESRRRWFLLVYGLFVISSILKATDFGIQHQGGPLVLIAALCPLGLLAVRRLGPTVAWVVTLLAIAFPIWNTFGSIHQRKLAFEHESAGDWIAEHVPPGTRVYLPSTPSPHRLLPTIAASDVLWKEVNDQPNWTLKLNSAMARLNIPPSDYPRALSDENMLVERGNRRTWFILGSRPKLSDPRFDIRIVKSSPVFGIRNPNEVYKQTGGVYLHYGSLSDEDVAGFGPPAAAWYSGKETGTFVFYTPEKTQGKP